MIGIVTFLWCWSNRKMFFSADQLPLQRIVQEDCMGRCLAPPKCVNKSCGNRSNVEYGPELLSDWANIIKHVSSMILAPQSCMIVVHQSWNLVSYWSSWSKSQQNRFWSLEAIFLPIFVFWSSLGVDQWVAFLPLSLGKRGCGHHQWSTDGKQNKGGESLQIQYSKQYHICAENIGPWWMQFWIPWMMDDFRIISSQSLKRSCMEHGGAGNMMPLPLMWSGFLLPACFRVTLE